MRLHYVLWLHREDGSELPTQDIALADRHYWPLAQQDEMDLDDGLNERQRAEHDASIAHDVALLREWHPEWLDGSTDPEAEADDGVGATEQSSVLPAHRQVSTFHRAARDMVEPLAAGPSPCANPWPCVHEFLATVTHPRLFRTPSTLSAACDQLEPWLEISAIRLLGEDPEDASLRLASATRWSEHVPSHASPCPAFFAPADPASADVIAS